MRPTRAHDEVRGDDGVQTAYRPAYALYENFASFREAWCQNHFGWELTPQRADGYNGALYSRQYNGVTYSDIVFDALSGERRTSHISSQDDYVGLNLFVHGQESIAQHGQTEIVAAGELFLWDVNCPARFVTEAKTRCLSVFVPKSKLERRAPGLRSLLGRKADCSHGLGQLLTSHILNLHRVIDSMSAESRIEALDVTLDMVSACFQPADGHAKSDHIHRTFQRIARFIEDNLGDDQLSATRCASALGLSDRYMRRLFAQYGASFSSYVRLRRLELIARQLRATTRAGQSITTIAANYGFSDPSYFSRQFLAQFGVTPSAYRQSGRERICPTENN